MKTTAKIKHRDYVPWGWIAIEFCDVEFYGARAKELEKEWHEIEFAKYHEQKPIAENYKTQKYQLEKEIKDIQKQLKESKKWYRFWYNKDEKNLIHLINEKSTTIKNLEVKIESVESDMFYKASTLLRKVEHFLKNKGFVLTNTTAAGDECVTYTDIWSD